MTDPDFPADFPSRHPNVPARPCGQPPADSLDRPPQHHRPAGVGLEMFYASAVDYGVDGSMGMNLRPMLDLIAAEYDRCHPCVKYHQAATAADPALTTHMVGVALSVLGIDAATAAHLDAKLSSPGAAVALTIRNEGVEQAVKVAERIAVAERVRAVGAALEIVVPTSLYDTPVSNVSPLNRRLLVGLGDERVMDHLRAAGYLP